MIRRISHRFIKSHKKNINHTLIRRYPINKVINKIYFETTRYLPEQNKLRATSANEMKFIKIVWLTAIITKLDRGLMNFYILTAGRSVTSI